MGWPRFPLCAVHNHTANTIELLSRAGLHAVIPTWIVRGVESGCWNVRCGCDGCCRCCGSPVHRHIVNLHTIDVCTSPGVVAIGEDWTWCTGWRQNAVCRTTGNGTEETATGWRREVHNHRACSGCTGEHGSAFENKYFLLRLIRGHVVPIVPYTELQIIGELRRGKSVGIVRSCWIRRG